MNWMSLNIRGMRETPKITWARRLKIKHRLFFFGIQETQLTNAEDIDVGGC